MDGPEIQSNPTARGDRVQAPTHTRPGPAAELATAPVAWADAASAKVLARVALLEEQLRVEQARNAELRADVSWMAPRLEAAADDRLSASVYDRQTMRPAG